MEQAGILDSLVEIINGILSGGYSLMSEDLRSLLSVLVGLDFMIAALAWMLAYLQIFQLFLGKLLRMCVFVMLFTGFAVLTQLFIDFVIWGGLTLGGIPSGGSLTLEEFQRPSTVIVKGFEATAPINQFIDNHTGRAALFNFWMLAEMSVAAVGIWVAFVFMALHLVFLLILVRMAAGFCLLTLPFAGFTATAFLASNGFALFLASAMRLGVAAAIVALAFPFIEEFFLSPEAITMDPRAVDVHWLFIGSWLIAALSILFPGIAHGMFAGGPLLSAGNLVPGLALYRTFRRAA